MANKPQSPVPGIRPITGQEAPPPPVVLPRQTAPSRDAAPLPRRDTVLISDAARKAASRPAAPLPGSNGSGASSNGDLRFNYNPDTNTLQAKIVDANGRTLSEIPTDAQIKAREQLSEFFAKSEKGSGEA